MNHAKITFGAGVFLLLVLIGCSDTSNPPPEARFKALTGVDLIEGTILSDWKTRGHVGGGYGYFEFVLSDEKFDQQFPTNLFEPFTEFFDETNWVADFGAMYSTRLRHEVDLGGMDEYRKAAGLVTVHVFRNKTRGRIVVLTDE